MTEKELLVALKARLQALTWDGSNVIFHTNSVVVTASPNEDALAKLIMPILLIHPGTKVADREQPNLYQEEIEMAIITSIPGDALGQNAIMGANRTADTSKGAGIVDIEEAVLGDIAFLNAREGIVIKHTFSGASSIGKLGESSWITFRKLRFEAKISSVNNPGI